MADYEDDEAYNGYSRKHRSSDSRSSSRSHSRRRSRSRSYSSRSRSGSFRGRRGSRSPLSSRKRHVGPRDNPPTSKSLGVFGLSLDTTEKILRRAFEEFSNPINIDIVNDRRTGRSRGFAFMSFASMDDAAIAKDKSSGMDIDGKTVRVEFSITKKAHTPTPGVYMGRPVNYRQRRPYNNKYDDDYSYGYRRRSPSPYTSRRRSPSPYYSRRRSPSPYYRRRSPSPYYSRRRRSYSRSPRRYY